MYRRGRPGFRPHFRPFVRPPLWGPRRFGWRRPIARGWILLPFFGIVGALMVGLPLLLRLLFRW